MPLTCDPSEQNNPLNPLTAHLRRRGFVCTREVAFASIRFDCVATRSFVHHDQDVSPAWSELFVLFARLPELNDANLHRLGDGVSRYVRSVRALEAPLKPVVRTPRIQYLGVAVVEHLPVGQPDAPIEVPFAFETATARLEPLHDAGRDQADFMHELLAA